MKRRIHLTENQLHRLIEQSINEIGIETKMSAAQKAARETEDYRDQYRDNSTPRLKRKYAIDMARKRQRQRDTFINGVNSDAKTAYGVTRADYDPDYNAFPTRGSMTVDEPIFYGSTSTSPLFNNSSDLDRGRWEDYLRGNSYYENGKWKRPGSIGYDIAKSEPWSEIRKNHNESVARRVTESVMRKLRGVNEANGAPNRPSDSLHLNWYEWTQMVLRKLKKLLVGKDVIFRKTVYGRDNRPRGENRMCRITSISINNGTEMTNTDYCFNIWMINSDNGEKELTPMGEMRMACLLERGWGEGDWGDIKLVDGAESLPQEEAQEMIAELGGTEWMQYCADYNHIQ